jgi:hypothetical protein
MYTVKKGATSWKVVHKLNKMEVYYALSRDEARKIAGKLNEK